MFLPVGNTAFFGFGGGFLLFGGFFGGVEGVGFF